MRVNFIIYQMSRDSQSRDSNFRVTEIYDEIMKQITPEMNQPTPEMKQITPEMKQSREKLDGYINGLNRKISSIISSETNKLTVIHRQIIILKQKQIRALQQRNQKLNDSEINQYVKELQHKLAQCKQDMDRITKVLSVFKNEAEKYRIQLQIKEKQVQACKKRQKKLIKQMWALEENIKDIYSYDFITQSINHPQLVNSISHHSLSHETQKIRCRVTNNKQLQQRLLYTEQINKPIHQRINTYAGQPHSAKSKASIYDKTNLCEKLNKNYKKHKESRTLKPHSQLNKNSRPIWSRKRNNYSIYDDLRHSIRKINRIDIEQPKYLKDQDKLIGRQQFELISLNAPKIMKFVEKIVIQEYGQLKKIDQCSIELLNELFQNPNAVKILQIMLFTYSVQALRDIRQNKQFLKEQNFYSRPTLSQKEQAITSVKVFAKKDIVQSQIRKNFKNNHHKAILSKNMKNTAN